MKSLALWGVVAALLLVLGGCGTTGGPGSTYTITPAATPTGGNTSTKTAQQGFGPEPNWGVQTKTSGCQANGPIQDKACTPGDIFPDATKEKICVPGYASSVRNVSQSLKEKVYASYGVKKRSPGQYEVDHLVSLQLGGSNSIANLWPEPASPKPGFHEKDRVENYLHDQVCKGAISLKQAQIQIATNWLAVYNSIPQQYNGEDQDDSSS
ncbi:MAG: HNH endonuclease [Ktedonobacteraceae bacterium]|nr:HNH endonuclease [Ktedonobacteraceae bacterium]